MIESAPAKINLWLRVLAREDSGYHQLETLFCALQLADRLEVSVLASPRPRDSTAAAPLASSIHLDVYDAELGAPEDNLVYRAARLFLEESRAVAQIHIRLDKRIPAGAGLGGGSSDAAATLRALNSLLGHPLAPERLMALGAMLGADVPFFLGSSPLALAWGRGERLLALPPLPAVPVLLALPAFGSPTPEAYRLHDLHRATVGDPTAAGAGASAAAGAGGGAGPHPSSPPPRAGQDAAQLHPNRLTSWREVAPLVVNDFEAPLFQRFPPLAELKVALQGTGPLFALLAGSGSALFALYSDSGVRDRAAFQLAARFPDTRFLPTTTAAV